VRGFKYGFFVAGGMSQAGYGSGFESDGWSVVAHHDWDGHGTLETTLRDVVVRLDGDDGDSRLYEHVDVEALRDVMAPDADRGASAVSFEYHRHELRVSGDGTVAVR
jgi:hypothetical protein